MVLKTSIGSMLKGYGKAAQILLYRGFQDGFICRKVEENFPFNCNVLHINNENLWK